MRGKRSTGRSRHGKGWVGWVLSLVLGSLLIMLAYNHLIREKPRPPEPFSHEVSRVDQIIKNQFYEIGVAKKDVLDQRTVPRKEGKSAWEESDIKIRLPGSLSGSRVEENLKRSLSSAGTPVSVTSSQDSDSLRIEVKVRGRLTHHLTFLLPEASSPKASHGPRMAIVIDDLGGENRISKELLDWDSQLTFSILPFAPYSKSLAREAHRRGKEIILHLPMEPRGYPGVKPGEGVLLHRMADSELLLQLSKDIDAVPFIKGVSNHMGSRLMEEPDKVKIILAELKRRGLFFLDSRTTPGTVGLQVARSLGLRTMERTVFIDHLQGEKEIREKLEQLIQISLTSQKAIGVGHPHPSTIRSLKEMIPRMKEKRIEIVPLSVLME
jgi:uncharacterized protein